MASIDRRKTSKGETRWEVWRAARRRAVLKANRTHWTDRHVRVGSSYAYRVRPCRRSRCAKSVTVRLKVRGAAGAPPVAGGGGGGSGTGTSGADPFAGSPTVGGCPVFPKDNPALREAFNTGFAKIRADGTYDKIYAKWFGQPPSG